MDIKKTNTVSSPGEAYRPDAKAGRPNALKTAATSPAHGDARVNLSATSQMGLQASDADLRMDKVQAIRAALANGTLVISPERIADELINSAKELVS